MNEYFVGAVVVTFHPDLGRMARLLHNVGHQVDQVVVIDNGSSQTIVQQLRARAEQYVHCTVIALGQNMGVAYAQNKGLDKGRLCGWTHGLLLDQDSDPAPNMVEELLRAYDFLKHKTERIAALGPKYINLDYANSSYFVQFARLGIRRRFCSSEDDREAIVPADFLISSGALLSMRAYEDVGTMEETLFIDHVDTDWFLRAKARNWRSFGICSATMWHKLGERTVRVRLPGYVRYAALYDPLRYYYLARNTFWMARRPYVPLVVKISLFNRLLRASLIRIACGSARLRVLQHAGMGLKHGVQGKMF